MQNIHSLIKQSAMWVLKTRPDAAVADAVRDACGSSGLHAAAAAPPEGLLVLSLDGPGGSSSAEDAAQMTQMLERVQVMSGAERQIRA